jgi:hypothetical protein
MVLGPLSVSGCSGLENTPGGGVRAGLKTEAALESAEVVTEVMIEQPAAERTGGSCNDGTRRH